jgi:hypothetical protein
MKTKAERPFETSAINNPGTQLNNKEALNLSTDVVKTSNIADVANL